jgi:hypothetical protein
MHTGQTDYLTADGILITPGLRVWNTYRYRDRVFGVEHADDNRIHNSRPAAPSPCGQPSGASSTVPAWPSTIRAPVSRPTASSSPSVAQLPRGSESRAIGLTGKTDTGVCSPIGCRICLSGRIGPPCIHIRAPTEVEPTNAR